MDDDEAQERSFLEQTRVWYAAGERDIDGLCDVALLGSGSSAYVRFSEGPFSRLWFASCYGWCTAVRWLIDNGADVNLCDAITGITPLHAGCEGHFNAASMLLDAGANVDARSAVIRHNRTALHSAAVCNNLSICKLLLSHGASLYATDVDGETPETYARLCRSTQAANFLADVRSAGSWQIYVAAPRAALLALRRELPALRESGRATSPSSVPAHERLFFQAPDDVFSHIIKFWRSDRDL